MSLEELNPLIDDAAQEAGVHPALLRAVIQIASAFRPYKISAQGRVGLMQVPQDLARSGGIGDLFDPYENIRAGARYLKQLIDEFDSTRLALAAYAETPDLVRRQHEGLRPRDETRLFVGDVLRAYSNLMIIYRDLKR